MAQEKPQTVPDARVPYGADKRLDAQEARRLESRVPEVLLRKPQVLEIIGLSNSTFYARIRDGSIKPGVPIGPRIKAWPASEIQDFVEGCVAKRGTGVER